MPKAIRNVLKRSAACLAVISVLLMSSCGRPTPAPTDLMAILLAELEHPEVTIYFDGAAREGEGWMSEEAYAALYDGHSPTSLADSYAVALCRDDRIYELHLYYALNTERALQLEECLRARLEMLQSKDNYLYDPDSLASSGTLWRRGRWVCLLVTEDNRLAKELLCKRI